MLLFEVCDALAAHKIPYAIIGGYAVNLHGYVRSTIDIDILLNLNKDIFLKTAKVMHSLGLRSRVPVTPEELISNLPYYLTEKNMKVWSFYRDGKAWDIVDFLLTDDLKNFQTEIMNIEGKAVSVITLEGLIRLKKDAGRPQDIEDLKALLAGNK